MKKVRNLKKILIMLAVVLLICSVSVISSANGNPEDLITQIPELNPTPTPNPTSTPTPSPKLTPTPSPTQGNNTSLPKTGVNDTAMWVLIGACGLAAIYTYKKVSVFKIK